MTRASLSLLLGTTLVFGLACMGGPPAPDNRLTLGVAVPAAKHARAIPMRVFAVPPDSFDPDPYLERCLAGESFAAEIDFSYAVVTVTASGIGVGEETVLSLDAGRVPDAATRGILVMALYEALLDRYDAIAKLNAAFGSGCWRDMTGTETPTLLLALQKEIPYETLRQVLFTAGQARFARFAILVEGQSSRRVLDARDGTRWLKVELPGNAVVVDGERTPCPAGVCGTEDLASLGTRIAAREGSVLLMPAAQTTAELVIGAMDASAQAGRSVVMGTATMDASVAVAVPEAMAKTWQRGLDDDVPVLLTELPRITPPLEVPAKGIERIPLKGLDGPGDIGLIDRLGGKGLDLDLGVAEEAFEQGSDGK